MATPNARSNQLHAELAFDDWFVRFRYGPPVCSPHRADQTCGAQCPLGLPRLLRPGFQATGSPGVPAGYHYDAKLRITSAGLSPASTAASLAAPPSPSFAWRNFTYPSSLSVLRSFGIIPRFAAIASARACSCHPFVMFSLLCVRPSWPCGLRECFARLWCDMSCIQRSPWIEHLEPRPLDVRDRHAFASRVLVGQCLRRRGLLIARPWWAIRSSVKRWCRTSCPGFRRLRARWTFLARPRVTTTKRSTVASWVTRMRS